MIVIGLALSVTVYFKADSCSVVYSCASSMISISNPSPRPPFDVLVRNWTTPPVLYNSIRSCPLARIELKSSPSTYPIFSR